MIRVAVLEKKNREIPFFFFFYYKEKNLALLISRLVPHIKRLGASRMIVHHTDRLIPSTTTPIKGHTHTLANGGRRFCSFRILNSPSASNTIKKANDEK